MKRLILNTFLFAMLSIFVVSCAKEKVQPFSGNSSTNNFSLRDGEDTNGDGVIDELDIVDGGNSSDYDSKGKKKKNP